MVVIYLQMDVSSLLLNFLCQLRILRASRIPKTFRRNREIDHFHRTTPLIYFRAFRQSG